MARLSSGKTLLVAVMLGAPVCAVRPAAAQSSAMPPPGSARTTPPTTPSTPAPATLDTLVVTGTRRLDDALLVPAAIDRIDADDITRAQPRINLSESLQRVPGVVARDRQNYAQDLQISIRGFGARATFGVRGVRLYTDGIPATMPDGQGQVSHFALDSADRIEVLRGPFSALYGNASGGVIQLFSRPPAAVHEIELGYLAGSDGLQRSALSWRGPLTDNGGHGFRIDATNVDTHGYRAHSAARRRNAQAMLKGSTDDDGGRGVTRYTLLVNTLDLAADDPQGLNAEELDGDRRAASPNSLRSDSRKTVRQQQAGVRVEHDLSRAHSIAVTAYTGRRDTAQILTVPVAAQRNPLSGGGAIDLDRQYHGIDARWTWSTLLLDRPLTLALGAQREVSEEARTGFENFIGDRVGVVGALRRNERNRVAGSDRYLQADWQPTDRWRINVGARRSRVAFASEDRYITVANPDDSGRIEYARTSPVAGALFRATPWLSVYANAGGGFETPTFAELAYRRDGRSGLNDGLKPARSRNVEVGLRARRGELAYSAAVFQSRTRDELVVLANSGGRSVFGNAGLSRRRGAELALSGALATTWHYALAYTYLDARYLDDVCGAGACRAQDRLIQGGRAIPGLSKHFVWTQLRWSPGRDTDIALEGRFVDRVFVDDANSASAPATASVDLSAERRIRTRGLEWRGFARINNLLDRDIIGSVIVNESNGRYYEPAPGRGWVLGLSVMRAFD